MQIDFGYRYAQDSSMNLIGTIIYENVISDQVHSDCALVVYWWHNTVMQPQRPNESTRSCRKKSPASVALTNSPASVIKQLKLAVSKSQKETEMSLSFFRSTFFFNKAKWWKLKVNNLFRSILLKRSTFIASRAPIILVKAVSTEHHSLQLSPILWLYTIKDYKKASLKKVQEQINWEIRTSEMFDSVSNVKFACNVLSAQRAQTL